MTAPADWWPQAARLPVVHATATHRFPAEPLGWILHVAVCNGSLYGGFNASRYPSRKFSHLWFAKDGRVQQYAPLSVISWAQGAGNSTYWSAETEGFPEEPLTNEQLDSLAAWHAWSRSPDALAAAPGQRGIGTHWMGGPAWGDGRTPHTCPDPKGGLPGPRSHQRAEILRRATIGGTDVLEADMDRIVDKLMARLSGWVPPSTGETPPPNWQTVVGRTYSGVNQLLATAATGGVDVHALAGALAAALPAGSLTADQVADAVVAKLPDVVLDKLATRLVR